MVYVRFTGTWIKNAFNSAASLLMDENCGGVIGDRYGNHAGNGRNTGRSICRLTLLILFC